jgi:hypothetical protein
LLRRVLCLPSRRNRRLRCERWLPPGGRRGRRFLPAGRWGGHARLRAKRFTGWVLRLLPAGRGWRLGRLPGRLGHLGRGWRERGRWRERRGRTRNLRRCCRRRRRRRNRGPSHIGSTPGRGCVDWRRRRRNGRATRVVGRVGCCVVCWLAVTEISHLASVDGQPVMRV